MRARERKLGNEHCPISLLMLIFKILMLITKILTIRILLLSIKILLRSINSETDLIAWSKLKKENIRNWQKYFVVSFIIAIFANRINDFIVFNI